MHYVAPHMARLFSTFRARRPWLRFGRSVGFAAQVGLAPPLRRALLSRHQQPHASSRAVADGDIMKSGLCGFLLLVFRSRMKSLRAHLRCAPARTKFSRVSVSLLAKRGKAACIGTISSAMASIIIIIIITEAFSSKQTVSGASVGRVKVAVPVAVVVA